MKKIIFLIIMTLITTIGYSQVDTPFDKNHITDKKQLKEAKKKIKEGDKLFAMGKGTYIDALTYYLEANKINPNNADLNYKIGICYIFTTDKQLGLEHLEKSKQLNPQVNYELSYYLGRAYHLNYQFDKAIEYYKEFKNRLFPKKFAVRGKEMNKYIEECENGKELITNPLNIQISNMGSTINTIYPDYAPVISADEEILFFTSRRPSTTGGKRDPSDNKYYEDIYMATKKDTIWQLTTIPDLNDKKHNGAIGMYSWEGKTYLYTYKSKHNGDIYESIINDNKITIPERLPYPINTRFKESSASLSPDGNYLYFISDRPGSMGGKDIWMSQREYNDVWTNPINLSAINTPYDEESVFIHPDGKTLYFSSKGHNTMGGYDIFRTVYDGKKWSKPVNLGYPINTPDDDLYFVLSASGVHAYISSSRKGTLGDQDIFMITYMIAKPVMPSSEVNLLAWRAQPSQDLKFENLIGESSPSLILWKGKVMDEVGTPLEAQIILTDNETGEQLAVFTSNSETGNFLVSLPSGKNYGVAVKKEGYLFHSENFNIPENAPFKEVNKDIILKKIAVGVEVVLNNIFFDFNKATLRPESKTELQNIIEFLQQNPNISLEISGHTDNVGSYEYNLNLSEKRAQAVVDYLIQQGISSNRLVYKGYSYTKPIASNSTEEGRQLNRRVEFKIIKIN